MNRRLMTKPSTASGSAQSAVATGSLNPYLPDSVRAQWTGGPYPPYMRHDFVQQAVTAGRRLR